MKKANSANNTSSGKIPLNEFDMERWQMTSQNLPLSYQARREVLEHLIPRYCTASAPQKSLLLDAFVKVTGYARKSAIRLLNHHPSENTGPIRRPRLPQYGPEVQQALFLAWKAVDYICAKRLIPYLPTLIPLLEYHGRLQMNEESRRHVLTMSVTTAERLLRTQRKPTPHGLSTTKAGHLLKHQIPIRTFSEWDNAQPGFLEADLVAHCGGNSEGSYLYTLTLTDVATGWTECLPLLARTSEVVLAALQRARTLLPFPMLGIDTDNGGEFINEDLVTYCEREHLTFTRGRPEVKNDQCFVEERNRAVVRHTVGHDRLVGEHAAQQLAELYRALRLYVNCFQPSMKLLSKQREEDHRVRRIYDPAKTPLQRLLLSGVLPTSTQEELSTIAQALDPMSLLEQLKQLQQAVFHCAVSAPFLASSAPSPPLRFAVNHCLSTPVPTPECGSDTAVFTGTQHPEPDQHAPFLNWRRSSTNPFADEWERILGWVRAHPERSTRDLFEELQRLFPGRYSLSHYPALQRGVRKIRAHLRKQEEELWPIEIIHGPLSDLTPPASGKHEAHPPNDTAQPMAASSHLLAVQEPAESLSFQYSVTAKEEETCSLETATGSGERFTLSSVEKHQQVAPVSFPSAGGREGFAVLTIEMAVLSFLQELRAAKRTDKTIEWHQRALRSLQQDLTQRDKRSPEEITTAEVRDWLARLHAEPSTTGTLRSVSTVQNYARSARAFCHWLVQQGYLERTPFVKGTVPKVGHHRIQVIELEEWDHLLHACGPSGELIDHATARNRALLWLLLETGLLVSEVCALCLVDADRERGLLTIKRNEAKERQIVLGENSLRHLFFYLDHYRSGGEETQDRAASLFLSETRQPLTTNAITLVFTRLNKRTGLTEKRVSPSRLRDTFAVRYLQAGGNPRQLQEQLGLAERTTIKRYQVVARSFHQRTPTQSVPEASLS